MSVHKITLWLYLSVALVVGSRADDRRMQHVRLFFDSDPHSGSFQCCATTHVVEDAKELSAKFHTTPPRIFTLISSEGSSVCKTTDKHDLHCTVEREVTRLIEKGMTTYMCTAVDEFGLKCISNPVKTEHSLADKEGEDCGCNRRYMFNDNGHFGCYQCCVNHIYNWHTKKCEACRPGYGTRYPGVPRHCRPLREIHRRTPGPNKPTSPPTPDSTPGTKIPPVSVSPPAQSPEPPQKTPPAPFGLKLIGKPTVELLTVEWT